MVLFARPNVGAVTLALLFGLYSMIHGFSQITAGVQLRQLGRSGQATATPGNAMDRARGAAAVN